MSRDTWNADYGPLQGFYRDRENGWLFGVCAGVADRFNFNLTAVRVIAIISLLLCFWPTILAYVAATLLIRPKPLIFSGRDRENEFWRQYSSDARWRRS